MHRTSALVNGVDPLDVSGHDLDAGLLGAKLLVEEVVGLQVKHARRLVRVDGGRALRASHPPLAPRRRRRVRRRRPRLVVDAAALAQCLRRARRRRRVRNVRRPVDDRVRRRLRHLLRVPEDKSQYMRKITYDKIWLPT